MTWNDERGKHGNIAFPPVFPGSGVVHQQTALFPIFYNLHNTSVCVYVCVRQKERRGGEIEREHPCTLASTQWLLSNFTWAGLTGKRPINIEALRNQNRLSRNSPIPLTYQLSGLSSPAGSIARNVLVGGRRGGVSPGLRGWEAESRRAVVVLQFFALSQTALGSTCLFRTRLG